MNKSSKGFNWNRMNDVYYSLEKTIGQNNRSKILTSLTSIVINFVPPFPQDEKSFLDFPNKFAFAKYVQNFISLFFGWNTISVGVLYDEYVPTEIFQRQTPPADFLVYYIQVDFSKYFPINLNTFQEVVSNHLSRAPETSIKLIKVKDYVGPHELKKYLWQCGKFRNLKFAVVQQPEYSNISEKFGSHVQIYYKELDEFRKWEGGF